MKKPTTYHLKLLATVLMVLDHIGYLLIPGGTWLYALLRSIGRLSAPLYWYVFSVGFAHTSDKKRYLTRLGIGAAVMMLGNTALSFFTDGIIGFSWRSPNIFLTMLAVGLLICLLEHLNPTVPRVRLFGWVCTALLLAFLIFRFGEYGRFALACILPLYFIRDARYKYGIAAVLCIGLCIWSGIRTGEWRQLWMLSSFPIMWWCSDEKPKRGSKYFFYIFYPAHLWILALIAFFLYRGM